MKNYELIMEKYLDEINESQESDLLDLLTEFFGTIDPDTLSDDQLDLYDEIMNTADVGDDSMDDSEDDPEDDEELDEDKKVRVPRSEKLKNKLTYKKNRMKLKALQKKYRKTAAYQKALKRQKIRQKQHKVTHYV